jgi:hypothetical protein
MISVKRIKFCLQIANIEALIISKNDERHTEKLTISQFRLKQVNRPGPKVYEFEGCKLNYIHDL